jgi:hypothetical protein
MKIRAWPVVVLVTALLTACGWGEDRSDTALRDSFAEVIGFDPPDSVTHIRCYYYWVRDSYSKWLCFDCDDATIKRIENLPRNTKKNWSYGDEGPGNRPNGNPNAPLWWKEGPADIKSFTIDRSHPNSDFTYICVDQKNHRVYAEKDVLN